MRPNIIFPSRLGSEVMAPEIVTGVNNLVLIGSNGAGKTRMGLKIEYSQPSDIIVHRISAQRALNLPISAPLQTLDIARKGLFFGFANPQGTINNKIGNRWGNDAAVHVLSDYDHLLSTLFALETKRNNDHAKATREQEAYIQVIDSPIDVIVTAWQDIMSQSQISFNDGTVGVVKSGRQHYHGKDMSDGERVILYLLGQCLCAPEDSIIIIDEPEIHLHKSLMARLWNKVEELCPNKVLMYITHDLDFAASRKGATKIWVKNYLGSERWLWDVVPEIDDLPENLTIEIIGNRKNIIFCEGDKGSYDYILYQAAFPDYHVIPRGGCEKVIESTKAFVANPALHHLQATGIIDGDYRTSTEITALNAHRIFTINVAEIENLLCIEPLLRIVAQNQHVDPDTKVAEVTAFIIGKLQSELELQVANHAEQEIRFLFGSYTKDAPTEKGLEDGFNRLSGRINVNAIYTNSMALFQEAINENSLEKALKLYNRKKLAEQISSIFGLGRNEYSNMIFRLLKSDQKANIVSGLQGYMTTI
jgi:hypothetical protein